MPEPKRSINEHEPVRIGLLGASIDTGNMGVSALSESTIKCIFHRWPDAEVTLLGSGRVVGEHWLRIADKDLCIRKLPIRFCKNIFLGNHFFVLCLYAFLFKVFRWQKFKRFCARRNPSLRSIIQMDMVADIAGGDSFSDTYGKRRFIIGFLRKWLVLLLNKDLVMLPQTYGPFKRRLTKSMARYILNRASLVYSRDRAGVGDVNRLLNNSENGKVRFVPDVAFVLDSRKPKDLNIKPRVDILTKDSVVVGLNVSGLLYYGGYTGNNMFGLKEDYEQIICRIIDFLMTKEDVLVLLVPHVFPPVESDKVGVVENDVAACLDIYNRFCAKYPDRIFLVHGRYDQGQIKYIIGLCDFLIGSRMHACIAALSQCIPAVGIAYSKKFAGVFECIGVADCVVDARTNNEREVIEKLQTAFERSHQIRRHLEDAMPQVKNDVLNIFNVAQFEELRGDNFEE